MGQRRSRHGQRTASGRRIRHVTANRSVLRRRRVLRLLGLQVSCRSLLSLAIMFHLLQAVFDRWRALLPQANGDAGLPLCDEHDAVGTDVDRRQIPCLMPLPWSAAVSCASRCSLV